MSRRPSIKGRAVYIPGPLLEKVLKLIDLHYQRRNEILKKVS